MVASPLAATVVTAILRCNFCAAKLSEYGSAAYLGEERPTFAGRQKGGFVKGWFWRMYPRSGFRSGGTCERTLVPGFRCKGACECTLVPVFVPGETSAKTTLLESTLLSTPETWETHAEQFLNTDQDSPEFFRTIRAQTEEIVFDWRRLSQCLPRSRGLSQEKAGPTSAGH